MKMYDYLVKEKTINPKDEHKDNYNTTLFNVIRYIGQFYDRKFIPQFKVDIKDHHLRNPIEYEMVKLKDYIKSAESINNIRLPYNIYKEIVGKALSDMKSISSKGGNE